MHTLVALTTTEAQYISFSNALCDIIPLVQLTKEIMKQGFDVFSADTFVHCKAFERN